MPPPLCRTMPWPQVVKEAARRSHLLPLSFLSPFLPELLRIEAPFHPPRAALSAARLRPSTAIGCVPSKSKPAERLTTSPSPFRRVESSRALPGPTAASPTSPPRPRHRRPPPRRFPPSPRRTDHTPRIRVSSSRFWPSPAPSLVPLAAIDHAAAAGVTVLPARPGRRLGRPGAGRLGRVPGLDTRPGLDLGRPKAGSLGHLPGLFSGLAGLRPACLAFLFFFWKIKADLFNSYLFK